MNFVLLRRLAFLQSCSTNFLLKRIPNCRFCDASGLPPKPKQPPGIFTLYYNEKAEKILHENGSTKSSEFMSKLGEEWRNASQQERDTWREKYVKLLETYKNELEEYEDNLTDDQRISLTMQEEEEPYTAERPRVPRTKPLEFPRRPSTAFGYFVEAAKEQYPRAPSQTMVEWMDEMADRWHSITDEEKQDYREASRRSYKRFKERKEDWESTFSLDEVGGFVRR